MTNKLKTKRTRDKSLPLIIVNPRSAGGATQEGWRSKAADIRAHFGAFSVEFTRGQGDGITLARNAAEEGRRFVIACGGDGTINEVANGILLSGKDVELGVLPSGTGGDLRRSLGMPRSIREAAMALRDGVTRRMDVGKATYVDHDGNEASRYFLNVASVGLAALIIKRLKAAKPVKWLPSGSIRGSAGYALSTLQEIVGLEPISVIAAIDDSEERRVTTINLCIANSRYFGGGMMIAPNAKVSDGYLDIVNIGDISTARILANAYTLYRGTHLELKEVDSTLAKRIELRSSGDAIVDIEIDGELPGHLPAAFEVVPSALSIRVPSDRQK